MLTFNIRSINELKNENINNKFIALTRFLFYIYFYIVFENRTRTRRTIIII